MGGGGNASFIFDKRISDLAVRPAIARNGAQMGLEYRGTNSAVVNARTTAHETVHFWVRTLRQGLTDDQGHCLAGLQYDDPMLTCLMHQPGGANGLDSASIHMHYVLVNGLIDSCERPCAAELTEPSIC